MRLMGISTPFQNPILHTPLVSFASRLIFFFCLHNKSHHHNGDLGPLNTFRSAFLYHHDKNGLGILQIFWIRRTWGSMVRDLNGKTIAESSEVGFDRICW
jgi:hypothetical protein